MKLSHVRKNGNVIGWAWQTCTNTENCPNCNFFRHFLSPKTLFKGHSHQRQPWHRSQSTSLSKFVHANLDEQNVENLQQIRIRNKQTRKYSKVQAWRRWTPVMRVMGKAHIWFTLVHVRLPAWGRCGPGGFPRVSVSQDEDHPETWRCFTLELFKLDERHCAFGGRQGRQIKKQLQKLFKSNYCTINLDHSPPPPVIRSHILSLLQCLYFTANYGSSCVITQPTVIPCSRSSAVFFRWHSLHCSPVATLQRRLGEQQSNSPKL